MVQSMINNEWFMDFSFLQEQSFKVYIISCLSQLSPCCFETLVYSSSIFFSHIGPIRCVGPGTHRQVARNSLRDWSLTLLVYNNQLRVLNSPETPHLCTVLTGMSLMAHRHGFMIKPVVLKAVSRSEPSDVLVPFLNSGSSLTGPMNG